MLYSSYDIYNIVLYTRVTRPLKRGKIRDRKPQSNFVGIGGPGYNSTEIRGLRSYSPEGLRPYSMETKTRDLNQDMYRDLMK